MLHLLEGWLGLFSSTEVGKGPGGIPQHRQLRVVFELLQQGCQGSMLQHKIPALCRVAGNVPQGPHCLNTRNLQVSLRFLHKM